MKKLPILSLLIAPLASLSTSTAQDTGPAFYGDPPDDTHPWAIHDRNRPQPKLVTPGKEPGAAPSDAIVLFDGNDLSKWKSAKKEGGPAKWNVRDGAMVCAPKTGDIRTVDEFGDCQLHIEWSAPTEVKGNSQGRGNSGVFLMGVTEVQVLDNYNNPTYADGFAGSVYGINPPMANALRPPGQFQAYDIVFRRPVWRDGKEVDPGYVTVFCNGVLLQDHTPYEGPGGHKGRSKPRAFPEKGPIKLQDHGNTTRFRNIWIRPLPPRSIEGGVIGKLTPEQAAAQREQTAKAIRNDADSISDPRKKMLRAMESLPYAIDEATVKTVTAQATDYIAGIAKMDGAKIDEKKGEVMEVRNAINYLVKNQLVPEGFEPKAAIQKIVDDREWNKK